MRNRVYSPPPDVNLVENYARRFRLNYTPVPLAETEEMQAFSALLDNTFNCGGKGGKPGPCPVTRYQRGGFHDLNRRLRKGEDLDESGSSILKGMHESAKPSKGESLYRGILRNGPEFEFISTAKIGDRFTQEGFTSTGTKETAGSYSGYGHSKSGQSEHALMVKIEVPKGTPVVKGVVSGLKDEKTLLPKSTFEYVGIEGDVPVLRVVKSIRNAFNCGGEGGEPGPCPDKRGSGKGKKSPASTDKNLPAPKLSKTKTKPNKQSSAKGLVPEIKKADKNDSARGSMGGIGATEQKIVDGLIKFGAKANHAEHVAMSFVKDKLGDNASQKMPGSVGKAVAKAWMLGKVGTQVAFATWKASQDFAERVAVERGMNPEKAKALRGALGSIDLLSFKPLAVAGGPISSASWVVPPATGAYLLYSTARNPMATARAAKSLIGDGLKHVRERLGKKATVNTLVYNDLDSNGQLIVDVLEKYDFDDWFLALFHSALDETDDVKEALVTAALMFEQKPQDVSDEYEPEDLEEVQNAFCPTGPGGGQDNSCGKGESASSSPVDVDSLRERLPVDETTGKMGTKDIGPVSIKAFRVGSNEDKFNRGVFFSGDKAGADAYSRFEHHAGFQTKEHTVALKNALLAGHQNDVIQKFFNTTYADLHYKMSKKAGDSVAGGRAIDVKIAKKAQSLGYDGIIYLKPAAPAKSEIAVFKKGKITENSFCPTGEGGGIDPTCSPKRTAGAGGFTGTTGSHADGGPQGRVKVLPTQLGGTTGAKLIQDESGQKWVMKKNSNKQDQLKNEFDADNAYRALGVPTPHSVLRQEGGEVVKYSKFIEGGQTLAKWRTGKSQAEIDDMHKQISKHFVADAWLANWDSVGTGADNILIKDGVAHRIDNGGALKYRAKGAPKGVLFDAVVGEINTLRNPGKNPDAAKVFKHLTNPEIKDQILEVIKKSEDAMHAIKDPDIRKTLSARIGDLAKQYNFMPELSTSTVETMKSLAPPPIKVKYGYTPGTKIGSAIADVVVKKPEKFAKQVPGTFVPSDDHPKTGIGLRYLLTNNPAWNIKTITKVDLKKLQELNPEGIKDGSIVFPAFTAGGKFYAPKIEMMASVLPPGTKIKIVGSVLKKKGKDAVGDDVVESKFGETTGPLTLEKGAEAVLSGHKKVLNALPSNVRSDIKSYTNSGYAPLNKNMRECPPHFDCLDYSKKQMAANIMSAIDQVPVFSKPVSVRRGITVGTSTLEKLVSEYKGFKEGNHAFELPSFTSTSIKHGFGGNLRYEIVAKHGLYVQSLSSHKSEYEVIMHPNAKYKVLDVLMPDAGHKNYLVKLEQVI